jgi:mono/diheme cytochrome c family protein
MEVLLEKKNNSFFQTAYINGVSLQSEPFDVVIGSGRKGQTYLYWKDDQLLQLPVSYYTPTHSWCNSPGYPLSLIRFDRVIPANCMECHGSYAKFDEANNTTYFDKSSIIYGVNCERCHGPAAKHVRFHLENPKEKIASFILTKKDLSRQQSLDVCALCHGGARQSVRPPFSFAAGDKLTDFSLPTYTDDSASLLDVHGNQYGLLTASKCFKQSQMNCASCHNVHKEEINVPKLYSNRCMNCHNDASHNTCTLPETPGLVLSDNCIDCHMPSLPSKKIFLQSSDPDKSSPDFVRTHLVAIYPEITKLVLEKKAKPVK